MHKEAKTIEMNSRVSSNTGKRLAIAILACAAIFIGATTTPLRDPSKTFTVVLDAGHGGKDPGNLGTGRHKRTEKDISLDVTLELGKMIEANYPDVEVVYTRKTDIFPSLNERVKIANKAQADLFISVHCNANNNKEAFGSETYVMGLHKSEESLQTAMRENASIYLEDNYEKDYAGFDPKNPDTYIALSLRENVFLDQSLSLAKGIQDDFRVKVGRKDRGVKQAGYYVISFTNMPSVLVELGFLTNSAEEDFLQTPEGKSKMSLSIYKAFKEFRDKAAAKAGTVVKENPVVKDDKALTKPNNSETKTSTVVYKEVTKGVKFQVQILTSSKPLNKKSSEFKGLDKVDEYISGNVYKYLAGSTPNFQEAKDMQKILRDMGFKDAFIVAFENGKKLDLNEAIAKSNK
jgi:N-acetylmuramoyl-L-alanine amidase